MDRHDLRGATAESVAQAHVLDLGPSAKHGVRFLSYWFDADKGAAFCLADAPAPDEMQAVHAESHGLIANEIISVSEDDVLRFLGRIREPADASQVESAFRTILFTDLQGSTALLHAVGEPAYLASLTEHDLIIRRALAAAQGREVKHTGDGIMASFEDVAGASGVCRGDPGRVRRPDGRRREPRAAGPDRDRRRRAGRSQRRHVRCDREPGESDLRRRRGRPHPGVRDSSAISGPREGFTFEPAGERVLRGFPTPTPVFELVRAPH